MPSWSASLKADALSWLLESEIPDIRYLARRDLLALTEDDPQLAAARQAAHGSGMTADILSHMHPHGYWAKPGPGYNPKYFSTAWALIMLAQMGASMGQDVRLKLA